MIMKVKTFGISVESCASIDNQACQLTLLHPVLFHIIYKLFQVGTLCVSVRAPHLRLSCVTDGRPQGTTIALLGEYTDLPRNASRFHADTLEGVRTINDLPPEILRVILAAYLDDVKRDPALALAMATLLNDDSAKNRRLQNDAVLQSVGHDIARVAG